MRNIVKGGKCLDVGCGRGYLSKLLSEKGYHVVGVDIEVPTNYSKTDGYRFVQGSIEDLPFPNESFETVIVAHVLEHVRNIDRALSELLRVTKKRLLIVLPRQREYRYVADLHVRYFPYEYNVYMAIPDRDAIVTRVGLKWGVVIRK